ncbi:MAG: polysaccharide deacetylase family protein [Gimesia sp.]
MSGEFTTVMYHYVREIKNSKYPNIKGLEFEGFKRQLDYLSNHYEIISADQLLEYITGEVFDFPKNACLLTFDDGYRDHIDYVLPELLKRKIGACFFPPAQPIEENILLDVNSIHFILASANDTTQLFNDLIDELRARDISESSINQSISKLAKPSRYDTAEVIFIKRMLQRELPFDMRSEITKTFFEKYVGKSAEEFNKELYMTLTDVEDLVRSGMYVGSHTYHHIWLDSVDAVTQEQEITKSLEFLAKVGAPTEKWIMCYPFGAYNSDTIEILQRNHCAVGFTTRVGVSSLDKEMALEFNRFDTNDFPQ